MHQQPDHFEIALTLTSKRCETQRIVQASYRDFIPSSRAFFPIANGREPFSLPHDTILPSEMVEATLTLDAVLPDEKSVPIVLYKRMLHTADISTTIEWSEQPSKKPPERLTFYADYTGVCIEDQDGGMIGEAVFFSYFTPDDDRVCALADEIDRWQNLYQLGVSHDPEANLAFDWDNFHAKGIAFCEKVQLLLGQRSQIFYRRRTELDPPRDEDDLVVFFPCQKENALPPTQPQRPERFEIALTVSSQQHGKKQLVCASYKDFIDSYYEIDLIVRKEEPLPLPSGTILPTETVHARLALNAILADGQIIPYALYEIPDLHTTELAGPIRWPWPNSKDLPERIIFAPDFGGACVQDQEGVVIGTSNFFSSFRPPDERLDALGDEIHAWQNLYECNVHLDLEKNIPFDWEDFHAKGIAVCDKAQQLLGHRSQVFYHKITELDPPNDENSLVVFFPD